MQDSKFTLFSFSGRTKILHLTWIAFFVTFVMWFNHPPLMLAIQQSLALTESEVKTILILNVALTIPSRIIIGILVDQYGPKRTFATLLILGAIPCAVFATAQSFEQLALGRFLYGFVGAGFVIGIRLISEWYPAKQVGTAEGVYGGWGNFGAAAAAVCLPSLALIYGGDEGWRYAIGLTGLIAVIYALIFYFNVSDTPKGSTYFKPKKKGAMEVTSPGDLYFYIVMNVPMYATLAVLNWKLSPSGVGLLSESTAIGVYLVIAAMFFYNIWKIYHLNSEILGRPIDPIHSYKFKQVALLNLAYLVTFGSEIAVVSMLPLFFYETFHESHQLTLIQAGLLGSSFAIMNLIARPGGGWISDKIGRKLSLTIFLSGLTCGYWIMGQFNSDWPMLAVVLVTVACSFFVQAGAGAVFAIVPLIKRRLTGQIAGMVGAYGNVGGVLFLTALSFVSAQAFFMIIGATAIFVLIAVQFLDEPRGHMAEIQPDGTVEMIEIG